MKNIPSNTNQKPNNMNAIDIIEILLSNGSGNDYLSLITTDYIEQDAPHLFGDGYLLGNIPATHKTTYYLAWYSDTVEHLTAFLPIQPNCIWVLDDGRCVFMIELATIG